MTDILDRLQARIHVESAAMAPQVSPLQADLMEARETILTLQYALVEINDILKMVGGMSGDESAMYSIASQALAILDTE